MSIGVTSIEDIEQFLRQIRFEMAKSNRFHLVGRKENMDCASYLGLPIRAIQDEIISLTYRDFDRGPLPDHDRTRPGDVWEFVKDIDGIAIYIKLKLDPGRGCVCISFHESAGPVTLPYRCGV